MRSSHRCLGLALAACLLATPVAMAEEKTSPPKKRPVIQLAILLDTSGSMNGLINQARAQLWRIVNQMAVTKRKGLTPRLELALFEYGKGTAPAKDGFVRLIVPLSTDLDKVSEALFALRTNGGEEYCGQAVLSAVQRLKWSSNPKDFKAIFIAGNERFTQGKVNYKMACQAAIKRSIVVNTIHCGPRAQGIAGMWADGALQADGKFLVIDQNRRAPQISAPQDKQLAVLSGKLNKTYLGFGRHRSLQRRQKKQDKNAGRSGAGSLAQRAEAKSGKLYKNSHWDLVDAVKEKKVELEKMAQKDLPQEMQAMKPEQRKVYLQKKSEERSKLKKQIQLLVKARKAYVAAKRKEQASNGKKSFDEAVLGAMKAQLKKKGFESGK